MWGTTAERGSCRPPGHQPQVRHVPGHKPQVNHVPGHKPQVNHDFKTLYSLMMPWGITQWIPDEFRIEASFGHHQIETMVIDNLTPSHHIYWFFLSKNIFMLPFTHLMMVLILSFLYFYVYIKMYRYICQMNSGIQGWSLILCRWQRVKYREICVQGTPLYQQRKWRWLLITGSLVRTHSGACFIINFTSLSPVLTSSSLAYANCTKEA